MIVSSCVSVHVAVCQVCVFEHAFDCVCTWLYVLCVCVCGGVGKAGPEEENKMEQKLGVGAHDCDPSIKDAEAGEL